MISPLNFAALLTIINITHVVAGPPDFVFGVIGSNVTICSQLLMSPDNPVILWYHENLVGDINLVIIISQSSKFHSRCVGTLPDASGKTLLTLMNVTMSDQGRYFAILQKGRAFVSGSPEYLVVTDTSEPTLRVYRSADDLGSPLFFCEVTGAGANWSDPYWQIKVDGTVIRLEGTTSKRIGPDGVFTRWSTARFNSSNVMCVCDHLNQTSYVFTNELEYSDGETACNWLVFLSPVCLLLILLTTATATLWTRKLHRLTATCQDN